MNEINVNQIINIIDCPFSIIENDKKTSYSDSKSVEGRYTSYDRVKSISMEDGEVVLRIENVKEQTEEIIKKRQEEYITEHKNKYGYEPNMFDGA